MSNLAAASTVEDMAGRQVNLPDVIERPYGAAPPITALLYALDPQLVIALNMPFSSDASEYLPPSLVNKPVIGSSMGHGRQLNPESLMTLQPQVAFLWKNSIAPVNPDIIEAPFRKIGIPTYYIKLDSLADWPLAFEQVGTLLGRAERGHQLAQYIRNAIARVDKAVGNIPQQQQVKVYYAETPDGLATDCHSSFHTEAIVLAAGYNLYRCEPQSMVGLERVSIEQLNLWQPQVIVAQDPRFTDYANNDSRWKTLPAVANQRIYQVPTSPLNWIDRPPSFMRALGMQWLAANFYPERVNWDIRTETRRFFQLFFQHELTHAQMQQLFSPAGQPQGNQHMHDQMTHTNP
ncbi:ABC transporter substrate-binding protein [Oceanobacter mangrovi]|uniref:ABC transporter substrate-binding protein n=1 Tax=Oceanobacter mangrovi TaxID=2862510 RepID=UPI001C8DAFDF|nr:ABC transporter substrate-binding protein [Oceanobacter mangrovi]